MNIRISRITLFGMGRMSFEINSYPVSFPFAIMKKNSSGDTLMDRDVNSDSDSYRGEIGENFMQMQASLSVCLPSFGRVARYINVYSNSVWRRRRKESISYPSPFFLRLGSFSFSLLDTQKKKKRRTEGELLVFLLS